MELLQLFKLPPKSIKNGQIFTATFQSMSTPVNVLCCSVLLANSPTLDLPSAGFHSSRGISAICRQVSTEKQPRYLKKKEK